MGQFGTFPNWTFCPIGKRPRLDKMSNLGHILKKEREHLLKKASFERKLIWRENIFGKKTHLERKHILKGVRKMKEDFDNEMKLEFISKSSNEAFARAALAAFAAQLDPTIEELSDIKTAVSEAVTNCIIHGYENKQGIVKIMARLKEDEIIIEISDKGKGIENIDMAKEPLYTTKPNLERSGMGFTIMESFMDTMEIESIVGLGTKITMSKKIKPKNQEEEDNEFQMITKQ